MVSHEAGLLSKVPLYIVPPQSNLKVYQLSADRFGVLMQVVFVFSLSFALDKFMVRKSIYLVTDVTEYYRLGIFGTTEEKDPDYTEMCHQVCASSCLL